MSPWLRRGSSLPSDSHATPGRLRGNPTRRARARRSAHLGVHARLHPVRRRLGAGRVRHDARAVHRVGRGAGAAVAAGQGSGLGHRRVLDAAGLDVGAERPRGGAGQAVGPHAGDPAAHRPVAARGHRSHHDGRGADHRRLRRAAGRRRHPHRVDLRWLRRAARRLLAVRRRQEDGGAPAHRPVRRDLGRHRRRAALPRPRLLGRRRAPRST